MADKKLPKFLSDEEMAALESGATVESTKTSGGLPEKALGYGEAMARGTLKGISPIPYEEVEAAAHVPGEAIGQGLGYIVQKAKGEPTAPVEPIKEARSRAYNLTEAIRERNPGVMEGAELGTVLGFAAEAIPKGLQWAIRKYAERKIPEAAKLTLATERALAAKSASQMTKETAKIGAEREKVRLLSREILDTDDERFLRAVIDRPDDVESLVKSGDLSPDELAQRISAALKQVRQSLGKEVGTYRAQVDAMTGKTIKTKPYTDKIASTEKALTTTPSVESQMVTRTSPLVDAEGKAITRSVEINKTIPGESALSAKDQAKFEEVKALLSPKEVAPRDILLVLDKIDEIAPPGEVGAQLVERGNIGQKAYMALRGLRADLKSMVRGQIKESEAWAKADERFHAYKESARGLEDKFAGDMRESAVNNLWAKGKTPVRQRLREALDAGSISLSETFFNELDNIKAAQGIKSMMIKRSDPGADRLDRIIKKYQWGGAAVGSVLTAIAANVLPWQMAVTTAPSMGLLGAIGGRKIGNWRSNPMRIIEAAKRSKKLSSEATEFVKDMEVINGAYGEDGVRAFLRIVPRIAAAEEIAQAAGLSGLIPSRALSSASLEEAPR